MRTELKDVIHLYLGCECMIGDTKWKKPEIHPDDLAPGIDLNYGKPIKSIIDYHTLQAYSHKITPMLRSLDSITEEEKREFFKLQYGDEKYDERLVRVSTSLHTLFPETFLYLLSRGFDLFGLIESGQAIRKTN